MAADCKFSSATEATRFAIGDVSSAVGVAFFVMASAFDPPIAVWSVRLLTYFTRAFASVQSDAMAAFVVAGSAKAHASSTNVALPGVQSALQSVEYREVAALLRSAGVGPPFALSAAEGVGAAPGGDAQNVLSADPNL